VAIGVGRAAVRLRVFGANARDVGARVVRVDDAVLVAIARAAVRLRVFGPDARRGGASVVGVEDAVSVAIGWFDGLGERRGVFDRRESPENRRARGARETPTGTPAPPEMPPRL